MTKAEVAVTSMIKRIQEDPRVAYLVCPYSQTYEELTEAYAEMIGADPGAFRQEFESHLQFQKLPRRK